ncbi:hypothetical protein MycrhDRAFT_5093 [Mycolicibacterium rhodesiae JS60]|nr:hypothetical protein MycrhDRAFT_5093 [Mycolicibacterium rhodesiae JS60]
MTTMTEAPAGTLTKARRWWSTTSWGAAWWQQGLAAAIAAFVFWPQASVDPAAGVDSSWQAGLALARTQDIDWGRDLVFTYGPWGFLQTNAYYTYGQSLLATIYQPIIVAALFLGIAAALRQRRAPLPSLVGALVVTGVVALIHTGHGSASGLQYPELAALGAFAWAAVPLLQQDAKRSTVWRTALGISVAAGFQLLIKLNIGLTMLAIALALSILVDWRAFARHAAAIGAFAVSVVIWWVASGQHLSELATWLTFSAAEASGYSEGMAFAANKYTDAAAVVGLVWIAVLVLTYLRGGPQIPRRLVLLAGLASVFGLKTALGRSDDWHFYVLLGIVIVAGAIIPFAKIPYRTFVTVIALMVVVQLGAEFAQSRAAGIYGNDRISLALNAPRQVIDRLVTLTVPDRLDQRIEQAKARQRALFAIPDRFIKEIASATVHVDPVHTSAAWAYNFSWQPVPVFQTYAAYTPELDGLNAEKLSAGPQFVLSRLSPTSPSIGANDGRLGVQESPRYSRALLCDYMVKGVENGWVLFEHSNSRCGPLTPLSEATVSDGKQITIPAPSGPDKAVLVGIDLEPTLADRLFQGALAPVFVPTVTLDGVIYRLIAANAAEPFLVSTPPGADGTNLQVNAHTIGVGRVAPGFGYSGATARLRFYEMSVASLPPSAPTSPVTGGTVVDANGNWQPSIGLDGVYAVQVDILTGRYRNSGGKDCRWARLANRDGHDVVESGGGNDPQVVTIQPSDVAFRTQNCGTWQAVPKG